MKVSNQSTFTNTQFVKLQTNEWLDNQRYAGKVTAQALDLLEKHTKELTTKTLVELNNLAEELILDSGGTLTFKGYKGFPTGVCISVNKQLVHGIPKDIPLQDGDMVTFDLGVTYKGAIADSAVTCIYGQPKSPLALDIVKATKDSLERAIKSIGAGKKIGCIGNAIYRCARDKGFNVSVDFGGHGISHDEVHSSPFICNKADVNDGIRIQPGLSIAIEPILIHGSTKHQLDEDGWTILCDGELSAHEEHTLFIHEDHVEVITWRESNGYPQRILFK